jgi:hypothetical protein
MIGDFGGRYVLDDDGNPRPEPDLMTWARWFESFDRHVALDRLPNGVSVSTVFLGLDHSWAFNGPPILWETMVHDGKNWIDQDRYASLAAAKEGHAAALLREKMKMHAAMKS